MELSELIMELRREESFPEKAPEPVKESVDHEAPSPPPRQIIGRLLSQGPRPYSEILAAVGGDEDALRAAIRDMPELIAYGNDNEMTWEIRRPEIDPVSLSERIGIRFEQEIPDTSSARGDHPEDTEKTLGRPVFHYQGIPLAWEKDPAHIRLFAWATVNLFPGRPLAVDPVSVARLLGLTPREVKDALSRLVKDGDLVRSIERGRELYRLVITYKGDIP